MYRAALIMAAKGGALAEITVGDVLELLERLGAAGTIEWVVEAQGTFLGTARLHSFRDDSARYAVGFFDPDRLGQGFGKEVTRIVVEYVFASLGLRHGERSGATSAAGSVWWADWPTPPLSRVSRMRRADGGRSRVARHVTYDWAAAHGGRHRRHIAR